MNSSISTRNNMSVISRLQFDGEKDLIKLIKAYLKEDKVDIDCKMKEHFSIARLKPKQFMNHPEVLGISIGGSNTKVMLLEAKADGFCVNHFKAIRNPPVKKPFYDFLDEIIKYDEVFWKYLKQSNSTYLGFSLPTAIIDNVPFHATKVATIDNLIARTREEISTELDFERNIGEYFRTRGISAPMLYYNMDAIIAHYGGISVLEIENDERSILLVCGTGLATADENWDRLIDQMDTMGGKY